MPQDNEEGYKCEFCGKPYKTKSGLNRHRKTKHEGESLPDQEEPYGKRTYFDPPRNAKARKTPIAYMFVGQ